MPTAREANTAPVLPEPNDVVLDERETRPTHHVARCRADAEVWNTIELLEDHPFSV